MKRAARTLLPLVALALALWVVASEARRSEAGPPQPRTVAAGESASLALSADQTGTFELESIQDYPRLVPSSEYGEPLEREGGRVVVGVVSCTCPVDDELNSPDLFAVDADGRRWEGEIGLDESPEIEGLDSVTDVGERPRLRIRAVFVVPADVADEVDVLVESSQDEALRFRR